MVCYQQLLTKLWIMAPYEPLWRKLTPSQPDPAQQCFCSSVWFRLASDLGSAKSGQYVPEWLNLWAETNVCPTLQTPTAVSITYLWNGQESSEVQQWDIYVLAPPHKQWIRTGWRLRLGPLHFVAYDSSVVDKYIASLFESINSIVAVEMPDHCKCNCVTSVEFH